MTDLLVSVQFALQKRRDLLFTPTTQITSRNLWTWRWRHLNFPMSSYSRHWIMFSIVFWCEERFTPPLSKLLSSDPSQNAYYGNTCTEQLDAKAHTPCTDPLRSRVWQEEVGGLRLLRAIFMAEPGTISLKDRSLGWNVVQGFEVIYIMKIIFWPSVSCSLLFP